MSSGAFTIDCVIGEWWFSGDTKATGLPWCSGGVQGHSFLSGGFFRMYLISFSEDGSFSGVGLFSGRLPSLLPLLNLFLDLVLVVKLGVMGDEQEPRSTICTAGLSL